MNILLKAIRSRSTHSGRIKEIESLLFNKISDKSNFGQNQRLDIWISE